MQDKQTKRSPVSYHANTTERHENNTHDSLVFVVCVAIVQMKRKRSTITKSTMFLYNHRRLFAIAHV